MRWCQSSIKIFSSAFERKKFPKTENWKLKTNGRIWKSEIWKVELQFSQFLTSKKNWRFQEKEKKFSIIVCSFGSCTSREFFSCIFPPHPPFSGGYNQIQTKIWSCCWSNFNENKSAKDYIPLFSKSFQKLQTMIEKMIHHCLEKVPYQNFLPWKWHTTTTLGTFFSKQWCIIPLPNSKGITVKIPHI
jgi:hypothetical protein